MELALYAPQFGYYSGGAAKLGKDGDFTTAPELTPLFGATLARLAAATPILGGADQLMFLDLDDTVRATYGYAKQGAGRGYSGVNGLNALLATLSTASSAPVIALMPRPCAACANSRLRDHPSGA